MKGNKMIVSSGRDQKGAMKLCDAAYLPSCDEISRETCECIAVRVDSVCLSSRQRPHGTVTLD